MADADNASEIGGSDKRRRSRRRSTSKTSVARKPLNPAKAGVVGGKYRPLSESDLVRIDEVTREILKRVGFSQAPPLMVEHVTSAGGSLSNDNRLTFSEDLIEIALDGLSRDFSLHGQSPDNELVLSGKRVHLGTGGAAPAILDLDSDRYRNSTLEDLFAAARLVDTLEHVHFFSRPVVARDMPDLRSLDVNTTYACLAGTTKHVFSSVSVPTHVEEIAQLCFAVAGSAEQFLEKPFLSLNINHAIPPLRFDEDSCGVMAEAARLGIPIHANTFGQMGASSPVTIAGSVAQTVAETLGGMIFAWLVNPKAKVVFGTRPMVTDLRTGAMSGGGGEQAVLSAAAVQMGQYYKLPNSTIAGAADSKIGDAQSGYEKCLTVSLAAHTGCNLITQACGMQASLMGCSLESYVIDNDMIGCVLRSLAGVTVDETTLALSTIDKVARGEGHFLGQTETFNRMQTDFLYPTIADRRTIEQWEADDAKDIREVAKERTRHVLSSHFPGHLSEELDLQLRSQFDIRLPRDMMERGSNVR